MKHFLVVFWTQIAFLKIGKFKFCLQQISMKIGFSVFCLPVILCFGRNENIGIDTFRRYIMRSWTFSCMFWLRNNNNLVAKKKSLPLVSKVINAQAVNKNEKFPKYAEFTSKQRTMPKQYFLRITFVSSIPWTYWYLLETILILPPTFFCLATNMRVSPLNCPTSEMLLI